MSTNSDSINELNELENTIVENENIISEKTLTDSINQENQITIELQLGDVIEIKNPINEQLNDKTFIIDYIDSEKMILTDTNSLNTIRLSISPDGIIGDGNTTHISIISRNDSRGYAEQNGLLLGKWINIYFGGEFPAIITGEITNLENDMIEIKSIDGDTLYLNFDYKGLPEDLPIELIEIREKPEEKPIALEEEVEEAKEDFEIPDLEKEKRVLGEDQLQFNLPIKNVKDQLRELIIKADQIEFGDEELGPIIQYVDVSAKNQRYSLETQVSDLLDELLSTIPNTQRTTKVLNNIHIMIERFKQLRSSFSLYDKYGNVESALVKESSYKPLLEYFTNFNKNLYWILPVVKNVKKIYNAEHIDEDNNDIENISLISNLENIDELIENYKSNNLPVDQNKYSALYSELEPYLTPFNNLSDESLSDILIEKAVNTNINTIIDNLTEMYSSIFSSNAVRSRRFVISKYNLANSKLNTIDSTGANLVTIRTNITSNDILSIKSLVTLPEPAIRFSKINLPGTNILDKARLNLIFLNYWELLKKKTNVNNIFIDNLETDIEFNEQNFVDNIKNYVLNLNYDDVRGMTKTEIYDKFVKLIIPKTKVLFNLMKKYINGKLSIVDIVSYLEPFLIYSDDLTYMQYTEITKFIDEKISEYNKKFIERSRLFKSITSFRSEQPIFSVAYSILDILYKNLREDVFNEGYDFFEPEKSFTNSEILRKMTIKDYTKLYTTALSLQSAPLMFPSEFSSLFEEEKKIKDAKLKNKDKEDDKCTTIIVAKYYDSIEALDADNDKLIYFDKKYDKTNYGLMETNYGKELMIMSSEELKLHIMKDLMEKKKMSESDADYFSNTLIDGHKRVNDGQYAILYKGYSQISSDEVDFYVRKNNKWVLDNDANKDYINSDESSVLCNIQSQCINVPSDIDDKCESMQTNELELQTKLLKDVVNEFDNKYKMTKEEFQKNIKNKFDYFMNIISALNKIETFNMLKYNNQKYKLGSNIEDTINTQPVSPYEQILSLILGQSDFVKKQQDIIKFTNLYLREANLLSVLEDKHWMYCIKTNIKLMPTWKYNLANAFVVGGQYKYIDYLEQVKSQVGTMDEGGEWWCDKNSGWPICKVDFDIEEGYEDSGFKTSSRAIMEADAGSKIISSTGLKLVQYNTPETKMINNIVNALGIAMGINIEIQKEFIINVVLDSIQNTLETENDYKLKVREMAEKGKKFPSYKDFYNTALLYYTLGALLVAIQTSMPSIKTRKTHPGCVRSFTGYPFEGTGDYSSVSYLACVAYDIRESGEPWNVLKGKKQENIVTKLKAVINDVLLSIPDVKRKMEEKTAYLLTSNADVIPEEHDIARWLQFLPPLISFKMRHLVNISDEFKKSLISELRNGSINQREKILMIDSKMIQFSLAIVERIQEAVKKHQLLLHSSNNEPYLENACCESNEGETTISYFTSKDSRISEYNQIVTQLSNMMEDIFSYSKSGLFYSNANTKNVYPSINKDFSEKTIYLAFIYFCKFKSLIPIPENLLPLCTDKPSNDLINPSDSIERIIQKLKEDGRNYKNEQFLRLIQIIGRNNIINIQFENTEVSSITKLIKLLEVVDDENDEVVEKSMRELILNALDTYDLATSDYTKEVKDLNNFLIRNIEEMKEEIIDFVKKNSGSNVSNSSVKKMEKAIQNLSTWTSDTSESFKISNDILYNSTNFYKNFILNFVKVFPNIILNKVNYDDIHIQNYFKFSTSHENKLKKYISEYYEKLKSFYGISSLGNILSKIQNTSKNLILIANATPSFTSIKHGEETIKPVFDERTSRFLFEYYLLRVFINYIELSDEDEMLVVEVPQEMVIDDVFSVEYMEDTETRVDLSMTTSRQRQTTLVSGNKKELRQRVSELFICFINIMNNEKDTIDTSYEEIQDRVFKLREREKDLVTDRLKRMTDEQRDADTILKINKLGMYSKGMQKGLTSLDKDFYDEEREFRDEMTRAERNIRRKNADANDENIDILMEEYMEQQNVEQAIDDEAYDMSFMGETYYDGNTDGVGAPEEEYDDYENEY